MIYSVIIKQPWYPSSVKGSPNTKSIPHKSNICNTFSTKAGCANVGAMSFRRHGKHLVIIR